jgi:hypothetical protein
MKHPCTWCLTAGVATAILVATAGQAEAARTCGYGWALPGTYRISGDFRGTTEQASAKLTNDCRVILQIPGVFSGGGVSRSGGCLLFRFKVEGEKGMFTARWCDSYGIVPWQGRDIRASVSRVSREPEPVQQKRNFNVR